MRPKRKTLLVLLAYATTAILVEAPYTTRAEDIERKIACNMESIQASFKAAITIYRVEANCEMAVTTTSGVGTTATITTPAHWSSQGSYEPRTGFVREDVTIRDQGYAGIFTTTLSCPSDPWLGPSLGPGTIVCSNRKSQTSGEVFATYNWLLYLRTGFDSTSLPNSTGFQYNRGSLIAQREADVNAEAAAAAAALQKQNKRHKQAVQPAPTLLENLAPYVVSPATGSLFMSMTTVPIKLAPPPRRMTVTSYLVKIERRDAQSNWVSVTNLPIGIAQAASSSGYLGWGSGGSGGKSAAFMALPGTYRISAQVSAPQATGWSQPVEFVVTAPNKTIQKTPKMFGQ
jgi:hypothetical protein